MEVGTMMLCAFCLSGGVQYVNVIMQPITQVDILSQNSTFLAQFNEIGTFIQLSFTCFEC